MSAPFTKLDTPLDRLAVVCRGCLADSGEMKNMSDWGLFEDFFRITAIETTPMPGISELLCCTCEAAMNTCKQFRDRCQMSDKILKTSLQVRTKKLGQKFHKNQITWELQDQKLVFMITAPKSESKINLPCPYHCTDTFHKKTDLHYHLKKVHSLSENFQIDLQYYCAEKDCQYHSSSGKNKWFVGRKFLNQHQNKVHTAKTYYCNDCAQCFVTESEFHRHVKSCNFVYICQICHIKYSTNERLLVHLKRKHPDVHLMYKNEKKADKRKLDTETKMKKMKIVFKETKTVPETAVSEKPIKLEPMSEIVLGNPITETVTENPISETVIEVPTTPTVLESWQLKQNELENKSDKPTKSQLIEFCDSPKRSLATQIPEDIRNDVTLPPWQSKTDFETKTDEISTQTVFEDLLSLKSQNSEDEIFFSEAVSLSDIQTQTFPLEFGLSRSHKETQSLKNSQTQSPDLSIKETQTCFCHYESPKPNFKLFDSLSSSPASINLTSTETQTGDHRFSVKSDVLLSFNSAETQTCFDDSSNDSM